MDDLRAKDLAMIEPPGSIQKIVEFTEQLSFGQEGLFAGTELAKPRIGAAGFTSRVMAQQFADRPFSFFPGSGGEGLDTLMSRHAIRTRDIQDFTRWLMRWEDKRSTLAAYQAPEQIFFRPEHEVIEPFEEDPEVHRKFLEGRRRRKVIEEERPEVEVEERVVKVKKTKQVREVTEEVEEAPTPGRRFGGHPKQQPAEPEYGEYWREQPIKGSTKVKAVAGSAGMASAAAASPLDPGTMFSVLNRGVIQSNLSLGSLSTGVIRGQADATATFQAQQAAANAVQASPVNPYMQQQALFPSSPFQPPAPVYHAAPPHSGPATIVSPGLSSHYPPPDVYVQQMPSGRRVEVTTDWPDAPINRGRPAPQPQIFETPDDYVIVPKKAAEQRGIASGQQFRSTPTSLRAATTMAAAGMLMPAAFASLTPGAPVGIPGMTGVATQAFAGELLSRGMAAGPGATLQLAQYPSGATTMPAGSVPRTDVFATTMIEGVQPQPMLRGLRGQEPAAQVPLPANPLMGQITLVSPPMQVASQESERSGSAVSFDVKQLAKATGPLDATSLAMLKSALPPGAQAIYPALPQGSLGPQAVNMKLAPSLLGQILTQGYGPQAAAAAPSFAADASAMSPSTQAGAPLQASLVPTAMRPMDQAAGLFGQKDLDGPGALRTAGAANASRGGALDFLGMPVRLAPSLSGNPETQQAAEARKVLPAGAAAIMRPNEFAPMRSKLFSGGNTIHAEPNKSAWEKAAPSFGLRDAEPHTLLSPDARIKPPHESAPLPQMGDGAATPLKRALHSATVVAPAAAAAIDTAQGHMPGGALVSRALPTFPAGGAMPGSQRGFAGALPSLGLNMPGAAAAAPMGSLGDVSFGTAPHVRSRRPSIGAPNLSFPALPALQSFNFMPAAGVAAAAAGSRVASRFSPSQPVGTGAGPSATVHEALPSLDAPTTAPAERFSTPASAAPIGMSRPGGAQSPQIPAVTPTGTPATPSFSAPSFSPPSMARPSVPTTTAGARASLPSLGSMSTSTYAPAMPSSTSTFTSSTTNLVSRAPEMPIAASVPASRSFTQTQSVIQRARPGGAVHANRTEHSNRTESTTNSIAQDPGASAHEVGLLANEVWSILKRKLQFEAERLGKRF